MKSTTQSSVSRGRHTLLATVALLAGAALVSAQTTGSTSSSTSGSSQKNPSYGTGSDVNRDTNKPSSSDATPSTSSTATDTSSSYNSGSSTYKSGTGSSDINASTTTTSPTSAGAMTGRATTSSDKLSWGDRRFVTKVADSGNDEIALAKLATEKASNPEVKSFAQKLIDDHQMVASELQTIASQKNVKVDKDADHDRTYKRLSKKTGNDFDQEFVEHMIDEHEKDIKLFEKAAKDAKDSDVRSFASKHVDHLREHLRMAENLRQTAVPTGRTDAHATRSSSSSYDTSSSSSTPSSSSTSSSSTPSSSSSSSDTSSTTGRDASSTSSSSTSPDTSSSTSTNTPPDTSTSTTPRR